MFGHANERTPPAAETAVNKTVLLAAEKTKIRSAVRTDFILSIEIVMIALGTVMGQPPALQFAVVSLIAVAATVGVYGLVALLVRMDDTGLHLIARAQEMKGTAAGLLRRTGLLLVAALPKVIKALGLVGTFTMLLVGGGMFVHNLETVHHLLAFLPILAAELAAGLVVGGVVLGSLYLRKHLSPERP